MEMKSKAAIHECCDMEKLYKVLNGDKPYHGGTGHWFLPTTDSPGEWMPPIRGGLVPCENGYHLCRINDLLEWLGPNIYEAEARGERIDGHNKVVVREARLLRRCHWDPRIAGFLLCDYAEHVLYLNPDPRLRETIATARRYAVGEATAEEVAAARVIAEAAVRDSIGETAWYAAKAVWAAAWGINESASWSSAWAVAGGDVGYAMYAAKAAERRWQTERLAAYLDGKIPGNLGA